MPTPLATPWPERAGGDLDAGGVVVLGVAGRARVPGAQRLEVGQLQPVPGQEQLAVLGQRGVAVGQDEPVAADPLRVGRVVAHHPLVEQVGQRRQAHRRAGVAAAGLLHGVGGQQAGGVHRLGVEVGPPLRVGGDDAVVWLAVDGVGHGGRGPFAGRAVGSLQVTP